jgi:hypothetical protein
MATLLINTVLDAFIWELTILCFCKSDVQVCSCKLDARAEQACGNGCLNRSVRCLVCTAQVCDSVDVADVRCGRCGMSARWNSAHVENSAPTDNYKLDLP